MTFFARLHSLLTPYLPCFTQKVLLWQSDKDRLTPCLPSIHLYILTERALLKLLGCNFLEEHVLNNISEVSSSPGNLLSSSPLCCCLVAPSQNYVFPRTKDKIDISKFAIYINTQVKKFKTQILSNAIVSINSMLLQCHKRM